jgi:hypothetical protein
VFGTGIEVVFRRRIDLSPTRSHNLVHAFRSSDNRRSPHSQLGRHLVEADPKGGLRSSALVDRETILQVLQLFEERVVAVGADHHGGWMAVPPAR